MNAMVFHPASEHRRMPWANGAGETIELLRAPVNSTLEDMQWRVSVALLSQPGSFSVFPGIDRTLLLLDVSEVVLVIDAKPVHLSQFEQVRFDGGGTTSLRDISAPCRDLNVMCRQGVASARVTAFDLGDRWPAVERDTDTAAWVFVRGEVCMDYDGQVRGLAPLDVVVSTHSPSWSGDGEAVLVEVATLSVSRQTTIGDLHE